MSGCGEFHDLLQDELDGRLAAGDAERLALHLASCGRCALEKQALASLSATFRAMPRTAAPAGFKNDVMSALPKGRVVKFPKIAWLGAVAAAAATIVFVVALRDRLPSAERDTAKAPVAMERNAAEAPGAPPAAASAARAIDRDEAKSAGALADDAAQSPAATSSPVAPPAKPAAPADAPAAAGGKAAKKADDSRQREVAPSPRVRYVVFRDADAAEQFARTLSAPPKPVEAAKDAKEKAANDAGAAAQESGPAEREDAAKRPRTVLKEASEATRRVVARTAMTAPPTDADLAARAAAAGGTVVPDAEAAAFQALLDGAPPAAAPPSGATLKRETDKSVEERSRGARKLAERLAASADEESGPFVVVVVVLAPAPATPPATSTPK